MADFTVAQIIGASAIIGFAVCAVAAQSLVVRRAEKSKIREAREREQQAEELIQTISGIIDGYQAIIATHTGRSLRDQKRKFLLEAGAYMSPAIVKELLPYLEEGMAGEDFEIDCRNNPQFIQRIIRSY